MGHVAEVSFLCLDYQRREGCTYKVSHRWKHQWIKIKTKRKLEITYSPLRSNIWNWRRCLSLTAVVLLDGGGIKRLPRQRRPRFGCNKPLGGMGPHRKGRNALENYATNRRNVFPIRDYIRTSLRNSVATPLLFLVDLELTDLEVMSFFPDRPSLSFPNQKETPCIQEPSLLLLLPLKYGRHFLLHGICNHNLGGEK